MLGGIHPLNLINGNIDASTVGIDIHVHVSPFAVYQFLGLPVTVHHFFILFGIPFTDGYSVVIVVSANKNHNGIYRVAMFFLQLVGLPGNVVPLASADSIDVWGDVEPLLQVIPVFFLGTAVSWVGYGIAKVGNALLHPRMSKGALGLDISACQNGPEQ